MCAVPTAVSPTPQAGVLSAVGEVCDALGRAHRIRELNYGGNMSRFYRGVLGWEQADGNRPSRGV
jgi:hypothetical protein